MYMAREKLFDDLDACLHWHPAPVAAVANVRLASVSMMKIDFHGRTAMRVFSHGRAGARWMPWGSPYALNLMREHLEPTARVH